MHDGSSHRIVRCNNLTFLFNLSLCVYVFKFSPYHFFCPKIIHLERKSRGFYQADDLSENQYRIFQIIYFGWLNNWLIWFRVFQLKQEVVCRRKQKHGDQRQLSENRAVTSDPCHPGHSVTWVTVCLAQLRLKWEQTGNASSAAACSRAHQAAWNYRHQWSITAVCWYQKSISWAGA